jgi:hypothetical protein
LSSSAPRPGAPVGAMATVVSKFAPGSQWAALLGRPEVVARCCSLTAGIRCPKPMPPPPQLGVCICVCGSEGGRRQCLTIGADTDNPPDNGAARRASSSRRCCVSSSATASGGGAASSAPPSEQPALRPGVTASMASCSIRAATKHAARAARWPCAATSVSSRQRCSAASEPAVSSAWGWEVKSGSVMLSPLTRLPGGHACLLPLSATHFR